MFAASKTDSASTGGYQISRSLRFNSADSAYLNRTPATATNRRTWTWSGWVKRSALGADQALFGRSNSAGSVHTGFIFNSNDKIQFFSDNNGPYGLMDIYTAQVFRDASAWYHLVFVLDTTQATASNRAKIYVNGVQVTSFSSAAYPNQNDEYQINTTNPHGLGRYFEFSGNYFLNGYMTEINFIDGQALTPSSFGETNAQTGVWQPKAYSGSYGTNGFYLNFSDNSNTTAATLGKDYSGNGNNWTPNNFSVTAGAGNDSLVDSPTSYGTDTGVGGTVRGNYATLNPLQLDSVTTLANGNLDYSRTTLGGTPGGAFSTIGMTSGKWYAEFTLNTSNFLFGVWGNGTANLPQTGYPSYYWDFGQSTGALSLEKSSGTSSGSGGTVVAGNVYAVAVDIDSGTISFYQNNTLAYSVTGMSFTGPLFFVSSVWTNSVITGPNSLNFGQRPFAYTAPSGFKALCTQNLPTPTIGATTATLATQYFNPVLYTGNGSNGNAITVGFQPDWTWLKGRSNAQNHGLFDAVRGAGKGLISNSTGAEYNLTDTLNSFNANGFTVNNDSTFNGSGYTYVAWNWKANGSGSTNTAGSITSTVSANTTSGFSVVTYTGNSTSGATVGHGLGVAPSMVIVKGRDTAGLAWCVYHISLGATQYLFLDATSAAGAYAGFWNNTAPTSTLFTLGNDNGTNGTSKTYVAYCFAEVAGYSKFGSYTGNGSADGPFVFTGFRPAYVMVKPSSAAGSWWINDNKRDTYNVNDHRLNANTSDAEATSGFVQQDFLSNGFKWRNSDSAWNGSGVTYIYMAFAENPFKYSLAR